MLLPSNLVQVSLFPPSKVPIIQKSTAFTVCDMDNKAQTAINSVKNLFIFSYFLILHKLVIYIVLSFFEQLGDLVLFS